MFFNSQQYIYERNNTSQFIFFGNYHKVPSESQLVFNYRITRGENNIKLELMENIFTSVRNDEEGQLIYTNKMKNICTNYNDQ